MTAPKTSRPRPHEGDQGRAYTCGDRKDAKANGPGQHRRPRGARPGRQLAYRYRDGQRGVLVVQQHRSHLGVRLLVLGAHEVPGDRRPQLAWLMVRASELVAVRDALDEAIRVARRRNAGRLSYGESERPSEVSENASDASLDSDADPVSTHGRSRRAGADSGRTELQEKKAATPDDPETAVLSSGHRRFQP